MSTRVVNLPKQNARAVVLDKVSPDRLVEFLARGGAAAVYLSTPDETPLLSASVRDLLVRPSRRS